MFHVPEKHRIVTGRLGSNASLGNNGAFIVNSIIPRRTLLIIASDGSDALELGISRWEHVSVHVEESGKQRTPTWGEMCQVKNLFWDEEDAVIQIHPPKSDYVNNHEHVLHLWRPLDKDLPLPESIMVGIKGVKMHEDKQGNIVVEEE